ncbi:MAG TPA: LpqB family beta-propeller domain-containing protein [Solirubrobacteraceae bacterium]|nr:LpqB family beta-propeller domain-containing protein [Solirubrobacteraceae bacterium]
MAVTVRVAYVEQQGSATSLVVADGSGADLVTIATMHGTASSFQPELAVSPDGNSVAAVIGPYGKPERLVVYPSAGGNPRTLLSGRYIEDLRWSPDSQFLVADSGLDQQLSVVNVTSATPRRIAGAYGPAAFAPSGDQFVYSLGPNLAVASATGVGVGELTHFPKDSGALDPLWSIKGIVFAYLPSGHASVAEIWSVAADGGPATQRTHLSFTPKDRPVGLFPVALSADGTHLLADFQDDRYHQHAQEVDLSSATAVVRPVSGLPGGPTGQSLADGISYDGTTVLVLDKPYATTRTVEALPWVGGSPIMTFDHVSYVSWNR